jgi:ubiquinone/menaquinone biosynthesis C-methylase UbiE
VSTYSLCTIPDYNSAMEEIRRVINPKGIFIFCEHGKAPDKKVAKWQNRLDPMWSKFGGGCHLNRDIPEIIINNGFKMDQMDQMFIPGWKIASYEYWGEAKAY